MRLSKKISKNAKALQTFRSIPNSKQKDLLEAMSKDFILAILESVENIIIGNVPLNTKQYRIIREEKKLLQRLRSKNTSYNKKRKLLLEEGEKILDTVIDSIISLFPPSN